MAARPWAKFYWNDWRGDPRIRACSLAAQGLWMQMLCIAADADPIGYVTVGGRPMGATDLARQTGASEAEVRTLLDELDRNGVFSRDRKDRIYNRRMIRDAREAERNRKNGKKGGNPSLAQPNDDKEENSRGITPRITPEPEARSQNKDFKKVVLISPRADARSSASAQTIETKAAKKAVWQQAMIAYVNQTLPADKAAELIGGYLEDEQWAIEQFNVLDRERRARKRRA